MFYYLPIKSSTKHYHMVMFGGQATIADFLKCGVSTVLFSLTYSLRVLFKTSVVCEGMCCEIFDSNVHPQHIQYIWFIIGSPWNMPLCKDFFFQNDWSKMFSLD